MNNIIKIDLSEVIAEFSLNGEQVKNLSERILQTITRGVHREWQEHARRGLKATRQDYVRNLIVVESGRLSNSIVLKGRFNNMIESGATQFDMKQGFSKSSKKKMGKKGWYLTIPFRMATPSAMGESEVFSSVMPKEVYQAVRKAEKDGLKRLTKDQIPKAFAEIGRNKTSGYVHKNNIYEGLQRDTKEYPSTIQGQYTTFRRVGALSDPKSWIHPGLEARNFAEKAISSFNFDVVVENEVDKFLEEDATK